MIIVTGASGQLGSDVCRILKEKKISHIGIDSRELDITDEKAVEAFFQKTPAEALIHCAAYTAVDRAEEESEKCFAVNAEGTKNLAKQCKKHSLKMIYISTDYVFGGDGEKPFETDDEKAPLGVYGKSKLSGERAVQELAEKSFIVRTSWVFGEKNTNFIHTMLRLSETHGEIRVVCDQIGSPTYSLHLAALLCEMVQTEKYGVYHATNEGFCSWSELAEFSLRLAGKKTKIVPVSTEEYGAKAPRPKNSRLSKSSLRENGFSLLPPWQDAVREYLLKI